MHNPEERRSQIDVKNVFPTFYSLSHFLRLDAAKPDKSRLSDFRNRISPICQLTFNISYCLSFVLENPI